MTWVAWNGSTETHTSRLKTENVNRPGFALGFKFPRVHFLGALRAYIRHKQLRREKSCIAYPPPENAVEFPLETSAKDGLARRLSPCNCVPTENTTAESP